MPDESGGVPSFAELIAVEADGSKYRLDESVPLNDPRVLARRETIIASIQVD
jgi:hypothetical protein